jgi:hypothetical protein
MCTNFSRYITNILQLYRDRINAQGYLTLKTKQMGDLSIKWAFDRRDVRMEGGRK